jgi:hypothetical protein
LAPGTNTLEASKHANIKERWPDRRWRLPCCDAFDPTAVLQGVDREGSTSTSHSLPDKEDKMTKVYRAVRSNEVIGTLSPERRARIKSGAAELVCGGNHAA